MQGGTQPAQLTLRCFPLNDAIIIRGARTHNLKNISCEIPHGKLTVVSGVSGSGKSSLAFDTIYAEGQRRYVESLSAYARQFLERIEKPDVDLIDGLAPAIAIKQKNSTRNPRSTVATATEIYDYLRLLYARCGTVHCVHCDGLVKRDSMDEVAEAFLALGEGTRLNVLFPVRACRDCLPRRSQACPPHVEIRQSRRQAASGISADRSPQGAADRIARLRLQPSLPARAASSSSQHRNRCWIWILRCRFLSFWIASWSARRAARGLWMPPKSLTANQAK